MKTWFQRIGRSLALLAAVAGMALATGCSQIDTGNVGVVKTGGQYKAEELQPGLHFTPISTVFEVSGKENVLTFDNMRPKTLDQITIEDLDIDIYFQVNTAKAQEIMTRLAGDMTKNKDGDFIPGANYVNRAGRETIYNVLSTISAADAQAKRTLVPADVVKGLQKELDEKIGKGWFVVTNANLRNLTVDSKLEQKIREAAQVQYEIDAKTKQVQLAKAEADRLRAIAQGEADAARIKAEGLRSAQGGGAEYLRLLEIQNQAEAIKKWDGKMPATVAGGAPAFLPLK